jgi:hypothetical protein
MSTAIHTRNAARRDGRIRGWAGLQVSSAATHFSRVTLKIFLAKVDKDRNEHIHDEAERAYNKVHDSDLTSFSIGSITMSEY